MSNGAGATPGNLSFLWATVVLVHCDHLYHLVQVDLGVQVVLEQHTPIYFFDLNGVMAVHDQKVVVNHLHHHLHYHHHYHHFTLGEVVYHLLHYHYYHHYHYHYHQVVELLHLLVAVVFFYPFLRVVAEFPHPHHLVVVVDLHHSQ